MKSDLFNSTGSDSDADGYRYSRNWKVVGGLAILAWRALTWAQQPWKLSAIGAKDSWSSPPQFPLPTMSRQIEQALLSLMPIYGSDLPTSLVELAGSLLTQSRHVAGTLKSDEEVARLYACAHIACDRLKITLDLPPIQPRPPIPPRIYKRLYAHLDNVLPNASGPARSASGRVRTPSAKLREMGGSPASGSRPMPSRATPTKESSLAQWRTPSKANPGTPTKSTVKKAVSTPTVGLHAWIQPATRFLCSEKDHKTLAPTILAGMEAIVAPVGRRTGDEWVLQNVVALFAAIYFFVVLRASGETVDRAKYVPQRKEILALLARARKEVALNGLNEDITWDGWQIIKPKDLDDAIAMVTKQGWLTGDWYLAIDDVVKITQRGNFEDAEMLDDEEVISKMQVTRADTMFQDRYDYLSEAKRANYKTWKEAMLTEISQLTTARTAMEIDT
ncbi:hypothetical protein G7046_g3708 [Stylonectria norvegica]|nr:hypothetical protein G7046_g3708 [Stylonectria norvegica]